MGDLESAGVSPKNISKGKKGLYIYYSILSCEDKRDGYSADSKTNNTWNTVGNTRNINRGLYNSQELLCQVKN